MSIVKKIGAFALIIAMAALIVPMGDFNTVYAASYITSAGSTGGSAYTDSAALAAKLNTVFAGDIGLYTSGSLKSTANAKLGSSVMTGSKLYYIKNKTSGVTTSGWQCFIYANAVYNTLYNEYVGRASALSNSKVVLSGGNTASYNQFKNAGVKCGAYIRTTNQSNGAYNTSTGHSMIVLCYNANGITYLEGNADGNGLVRIATRTWSEFNSNQLSGRSRYICHVVQPTDNYYNSLYGTTSTTTAAKTTTTTTTKASTASTTTSSVDPASCKVAYSRLLSYKSSVMSGNDVKYVQTCLQYLGYTVTVNSKYDSVTNTAVKQFQKDASISVDGKCGSGTWTALEKAVAAKKSGTVVATAKTTTTATVASANISVSSIAIKSNPTKTVYMVGDKLDTTGLKLTATYSDKSVKTVSSGFTCSVSNLTRVGTTKVTVTYGGKTTTFNVTVTKALKITAQPVTASAAAGSQVSFTVKATGTGLTYQWQLSDDGRNWRNSSIKTDTYSVTLSKTNNNRQVRCVITDKNGNKVTSNAASMKIK